MGAEKMKGEVNEICSSTRSTIKKIIESEPIQQSEQEVDVKQLEAQYVALDKELTKGLERLHA